MLGRRRVLSLLGIGAASAPLAAKAAADAQMGALTSLAGYEVPPLAAGVEIATSGIPSDAKAYISMSNYLKVFGKLPQHIDHDVRERAKRVSYLDPDIAALKSFSMAAKIQWQRERNYDREVERYKNMGWYETMQDSFQKVAGFRWPW